MSRFSLALGCVALFAVGCEDDAVPGVEQRDGDARLGDVDGADAPGGDGAVGSCSRDEDCEGAVQDLGECEIAICQTSTGRCLAARAPDLTVCDDGDDCTKKSFCRAGGCEAFPSDTVDCDDGDPCTNDRCDARGSCVHDRVTVGCGQAAVCGDRRCDAGEATSCPGDCGGGGGGGGGGCGDGTCDQATLEALWCPQDCGQSGGGGGGGSACGNGQCDPLERLSCPTDCPGVCGDGVCHQGERFACANDCAQGNPVCGDGSCAAPEDATNCPDDCP